MPRDILQIAALILALVEATAVSSAFASPTDRAVVAVTIEVAPIAEIDLPDGVNFTLRVPNTPHCAPYLDRDWAWWRSHDDGRHKKGKNDRDEWDNWSDADWNSWGNDHQWDDWDGDWQHHGWYDRCRPSLSTWYWPVIKPLRIPFTVTGNALASVSIKPNRFVRIATSRYLGRAVGPSGQELGYQIVTHFPAPSRTYSWLSGWDFFEDWDTWRRWGGYGSIPSWSHLAYLPGINGAGTPSLAANMVQRHGEAAGVIYIVARRDWTTNGKKARPGDYRGILELTIIADNL